jgi:hypothetical protein
VKAQQVSQQAANRGNDEGIAQQLPTEVGLGMPGHGPNGGHIENRHAHADQHGNQQQAFRAGQALGHGQRDEGVKAKPDLRAGGMLAAIESGAQPGQIGQNIGQRNAAGCQRQAPHNQPGCG